MFYNFLNKLDNSINSKSEKFFINNFINELQNYIKTKESTKLLQSLPKNTILNFAKYEGDFIICFDNIKKQVYHFTKNSILGSIAKPGEVLKISSSNKLYVDYTGIPCDEKYIKNFLSKYSN